MYIYIQIHSLAFTVNDQLHSFLENQTDPYEIYAYLLNS